MRYIFLILILFCIACSENCNENHTTDNETTSNFIQSELITSTFLGKGHRIAYERWTKGIIDTDHYNKLVKAKQDQYNRLLRQADLTQYDVFAAGFGEYEDFLLRETNTSEKVKLMRILSLAMSEDRVSYAAGRIGNIYGVVITISQKADANGVLIKDESGRLMRLFIPGLFKKSVEESFDTNNDT